MTDDELSGLLRDHPVPGSMWVHRKGGVYRVVCAAIIEATLTAAVVYEGNGKTWVRPLAEFTDGRFTRVGT